MSCWIAKIHRIIFMLHIETKWNLLYKVFDYIGGMVVKKAVTWTLIISSLAFFVDWAVLGIKLLSGNYDVIAEAYIGAVCFIIMFASLFIKRFSSKCPHCGRIIASDGKYCPHCGKSYIHKFWFTLRKSPFYQCFRRWSSVQVPSSLKFQRMWELIALSRTYLIGQSKS